MSTDARVEDRLRALAPQVLGALVRRHGQFDACEDAVQEALIAAAAQWPQEGVPDNPRAWLLTVAGRRLTDAWRSDSARRAREDSALAAEPADARVAPGADAGIEALDADTRPGAGRHADACCCTAATPRSRRHRRSRSRCAPSAA